MEKHEERRPPLGLPVVYFLFGHLALGLAAFLVATQPEALSFFLLPRVLVAVHLVTLGWVTLSILGALYIVAPMALRMTLRPRGVDWFILSFVVLGAAGVVAHFWIIGYSGVAWSGAMLTIAFLCMGLRLTLCLRGSAAPLAIKAHVGAAFFNMVLAGVLGTILAATHTTRAVDQIFAHAHLALGGFALMMVFGVGYRLLPMILPAKPPKGRALWATFWLLELGSVGIALSFWFHPPLAKWCALLLALGVLVFLAQVAWMLRHRVPAPPKRKSPDIGVLHTFSALVYLLAAMGVGLFLVFTEPWHLGWMMAYGVFALVGFLGQIVIGVGMRLVPMFSWLNAWAGSDYKVIPVSPWEMPARWLQYPTLALWTLAIPMLAWGLGHNATAVISAGGWVLLGGVVTGATNTALVIRHALAARLKLMKKEH